MKKEKYEELINFSIKLAKKAREDLGDDIIDGKKFKEIVIEQDKLQIQIFLRILDDMIKIKLKE